MIRKQIIIGFIVCAFAQGATGQTSSQPQEVVEAYRVCEQFRTTLSAELNFDRAFEATFAKDPKRRREIAITEGEFGIDESSIDDASLISAFKSRMQIFYLMLPLASPQGDEDELFLPKEIRKVIDRKPSGDPKDFPEYAEQLKQDAAYFRAHVEKLASTNPSVAERVRKFKEDISKKIELPTHPVKPLTAYSRGRILSLEEPYYQVDECSVIREGSEMRIVGIRLFNRLF